ncbi:MAG TPA: site-specific integrase [Methylomirabilota bacterium]|nr:site-specific integrase [Methylomirabilota bacterium]
MKFPQTITHRDAKAKVYGRTEGYSLYRLAWRANGKRMMASFATYAEAKAAGEKKVRELAKGHTAAMLTAREAEDAAVALDVLQTFQADTGRKLSLAMMANEYAAAAGKLPEGISMVAAVEGFLSTVAVVKRKTVEGAVEEFLAGMEARTKAPAGKRPERSPKYFRMLKATLNRFAAAVPGHDVVDLTREHLVLFFGTLKDLAPKTRNHVRTIVGQFVRWCVRQDYLPANHRLLEADVLRPERAGDGDIEFYSPKEFRALLEHADGPMRAAVALQGLAGLRVDEILRLDWRDVFSVDGHVEIKRGTSKTRQRRLVTVCDSLAAWLEPFRKFEGPVWPAEEGANRESRFQKAFTATAEKAGVARKGNGLRHAFITFHFAREQNENVTAAEAGNTPSMVHAHYKGLARKQEAEKWFAVRPAEKANVIPMRAKA